MAAQLLQNEDCVMALFWAGFMHDVVNLCRSSSTRSSDLRLAMQCNAARVIWPNRASLFS
jgi:hypothetical protein